MDWDYIWKTVAPLAYFVAAGIAWVLLKECAGYW